MSTLIQIADAVVAEMNAAALSQPLAAARAYQPLYELQDMGTLHVTIVPRGLILAGLSRTVSQCDYSIDVAVQKKLAADTAAEIDPLMALVEEIGDLFRLKRLTSFPSAIWARTDNAPVFAPDHLEQLRQFTSVLTLTFRVAR